MNTIQGRAAAPVLAHPQFALGLVEVPESLVQVGAILDRQSDQKRPQSRFFGLNDLPPAQVGRERLGAPPDGAERAQQVLAAERGTVQAHLVHSEVVAERKVVAAAGHRLSGLLLDLVIGHILRHIERTTLCLTVPIDPSG